MKVLLTGASGQLGAYLLGELVESGHDVTAWSGSDPGERAGIRLEPVDLGDPDPMAIERRLDAIDPDAILHAGAISAADVARRDPERAHAVNVEGTRRLAAWASQHDRRLIYTSTDMVFSGTKGHYRETDPAEPVLAYGKSKRQAEPFVVATPRGLVTRVALMFGPSRCGRVSYFERTLAALQRGEPQTFFGDESRTPLDLPTAARTLVRLLDHDCAGTLHVGGPERVSRYDLMRRIAAAMGFDPALVRANRQADVPGPEPRPADVSLDCSRLASLLPDLERPTIEQAVSRFAAECRERIDAVG